jgi:Type I phosphodiesterase / nucleotide pyrophosphatase
VTRRPAAPGTAQEMALRWLGPALAGLVALGLAAYAAVRGVDDADHLLAELNISSPPLAELPYAPSPQHSPALTRRLVLFVIDGLSYRRSADLPALDELRRAGVAAMAVTHAPSLSRPNYVSILTGVPPTYSGVRSNDYPWQVPLDSLLHGVHATGRQTAFATDAAPGFGSMFAHQLSEGTVAPWRGGLARAGLLALDRQYPLVVLIPGAVDDAGHRAGAASERYREAALAVDRQLRDLLLELDLARDTIVVTADHGHTARGGHGGREAEVMQVPLVMAGAGIRRGAQLRDARLIDLAPTVAVLLGTATPRQALGRTLVEALELSPTRAEVLLRADQQRVGAIQRFLHDHPPPMTRPLLDRLFAAFALTTLVIFTALVSRSVGLVHWDARIAAAALVGVLSAVGCLFLCSGAQLSLSALPNRSAGAHTVALAAALTACAQLAVSLWALRHRRLERRLLAAGGLVLLGTSLLLVLVGGALAITGDPPWLTLPPQAMLIALPMLHMATATYAASSGLVVIIELVVFAARFGPEVRHPELAAATTPITP